MRLKRNRGPSRGDPVCWRRNLQLSEEQGVLQYTEYRRVLSKESVLAIYIFDESYQK